MSQAIRLSAAAITVFLASAAGLCRAAAIPVFNTGVNGSGTPLADASADPHYTLTLNPQGGTGPFVTDESGYPFINPAHPNTTWAADTAISKWITPQTSYITQSSDVAGNYTYETKFSLTGLDPATAIINGEIAVDDNLLDILVNGVSTGITATSQTGFTPFTLNKNFQPGLNTLDFLTSNKVQATGNPTGVQIQMIGTASIVPEPATFLLLAFGFRLRPRRRIERAR